MKKNINKPYRQKGSSPHIYWVRACFTSELEIKMYGENPFLIFYNKPFFLYCQSLILIG